MGPLRGWRLAVTGSAVVALVVGVAFAAGVFGADDATSPTTKVASDAALGTVPPTDSRAVTTTTAPSTTTASPGTTTPSADVGNGTAPTGGPAPSPPTSAAPATVAPPPPVTLPSGHFTYSPSPASFGTISRAAVGANVTVTVTSDGTTADAAGAFVTGDSRFSVDLLGGPSPCATGSGGVSTVRTLQPGQSCTIVVRFDPSTGALGATSAQISIASEWGTHPVFSDTVTATVTA